MPKKAAIFRIHLDLLKPQSAPRQLFSKVLSWALSAGRYLIIFVEIIVLSAFLARFKLDGDLADTKEVIENQIPYIDSLAPDEIKIRKLQFQISSIKEKRKQVIEFNQIFEAIANQTSTGITLTNVNIENNLNGLNLKITGRATNDLELSSFVLGLKSDSRFSAVNLKSVALEGGQVSFSIAGPLNLQDFSGRKL